MQTLATCRHVYNSRQCASRTPPSMPPRLSAAMGSVKAKPTSRYSSPATCIPTIDAVFREEWGWLDVLLTPNATWHDTSVRLHCFLECGYDANNKIICIIHHSRKPYTLSLAGQGWDQLPIRPDIEVIREGVAACHYDQQNNWLVIHLHGAPEPVVTKVADAREPRLLVGLDAQDRLCRLIVNDPADAVSGWQSL